MKRNRVLYPLLVFLVLLILACVVLPAPVGKAQDTPTTASPTSIPPTATTTTPSATSRPPSTATTAAQDQIVPPTATLFPEKQLHTVTDQTKAIEANIPTVWTDMRTVPWTDAKGATIGTTFMASTDVEAFLKFRAEGVAISVSSRLQIGYTQLLDEEYKLYVQHCNDTYKTRWKLDDAPVYRGMYFVFNECDGTPDAWLSLFSLVSKQDSGQYIARVVGYDMIPTYGDTFRDIILDFKVFPENLP